MNEKDEKFLRSIMNYFACDKRMAETIIKSSQKKGEIEQIKAMCAVPRKEN